MESRDLIELEAKLVATVEELQRRTSAMALARQIKEYASDMRKNLLAKYTAPLLKDNSAVAAETLARANDQFQAELAAQMEQYRIAEKHLAQWDALHAKLDALRSSLSLAKTQIQL